MTIHKRTRLTPIQRQELYDDYHTNKLRVCDLVRNYRVSAPTVYKILQRGRQRDFSVPKHQCTISYDSIRTETTGKGRTGTGRTAEKGSAALQQAVSGINVHLDTKRLPLLADESPHNTREYLFIGIDDFSRELYAAILSDKTQYSAEAFLKQVLEECPYTIEQLYSDNGLEYRWNPDTHALMKLAAAHRIEQRFTRVRTPRTNGKAERVIRTLMQMWHRKTVFKSRAHRRVELIRFVNWYNTVKPHASLNNQTPLETLINYFYPTEL